MDRISATKKIVVLLVLISAIQVSSSAGWIIINPSEGEVGTEFWVRGGSFVPNSKVAIIFENINIGITTADLRGNILLKLEVPEISCGYHRVMAVDEVKNNAYTFFNVTPKITRLSSTEGRPGSVITITGKGFSANSEVKVRFVNLFEITGFLQEEIIKEETVRTNEKGTFEIKFKIPDVIWGYYLIYAYDSKCGVGTKYTKFEVLEAKTTPTPKPTVVKTPTTGKNELAEESESGLVTPPKTPKSTPAKTQKSTPGFELLLALAGISTALLVLRKFK
ncbi:MAG: IPT/TIG domain-containing protein [Archaeoglobaceae archaeon]|nr:IPT/TIG domain-containing protein [Archaeoglobaceae archaeon]MDW8118493.1 PGF-CTERM sorting domain-containing protein [Archaeoglobaceae archaeon]